MIYSCRSCNLDQKQMILDQYDITFTEKVIALNSGETYLLKIVVHQVADDCFGYFLNHFKSISDIDEIIGDVDFILQEGEYDPEYCLEVYLDRLTVRYTSTTARFLDESETYCVQEISLDDYKEILNLWKIFLQTPPYDKTLRVEMSGIL